MKKLLIIGAGFGQLPAIKKAKEMGLEVIVIDKNPNAMGMTLADFAYPIDVLDIQGAISIAQKHKISGVMTMQTDLPIPTVGAIVDDLGLKGSGYEVAERCSNKIETRRTFEKLGVPQPLFKVVSTLEMANSAVKELGFPCIIKAPDSSGSRGVTKVQSEEFVLHAFNEAFKYSRKNEILIEEYIDGLEIGAQGFSINGKCTTVFLHNDIVSNPPYMIPIAHSFPILLNSKKEQAAIEACKKAVDALGVTDGPTNIDLILDKNNDVKIIEIGARIGATCLPELVDYFTGIDYVKQAINACLGEPVDLTPNKRQPVVAFIIQSPKDGILKDYTIPDSVKLNPDVLEVEITAKIGDEVNILRKGTDRIGKIIVKADSVERANSLALEFLSKIKIEIE